MPPHQVAELGIVKTFQNPQLFQELSVAEHVWIAAHLRLKRTLGVRRIATLFKSARHDRDAARAGRDACCGFAGSPRCAMKPAASLSYGDEKMLGVAMALMCEPELLLLDEPTTGLGHDEIHNLDGVLRDLREHGTTLCIIDHKVGFLGGLADRAIAMHHGSKIAEGPPSAVLDDAAVIEAYLGRRACLSLRRISVQYGKRPVLREISLSVGAGEVVDACRRQCRRQDHHTAHHHGSQRAAAGAIRFDGVDVTRLSTVERVRRGLALSPEGRQIFPKFTVEENLLMGGYHRADRNRLDGDIARVCEMFPRLAERRSQKAGSMSGGEQQMLAIGRALVSRPRCLLLDEPSLGPRSDHRR